MEAVSKEQQLKYYLTMAVEYKKSMIAAKEQERRKLEQKRKNVLDAIAEESDQQSRAALSQSLRTVRVELELAEIAHLDLQQDYDRVNNVVDISETMEFLREFRDGAFEAQPVAVQAEILKCRIRRIVVKPDGVYVEIYGRKPESVLRFAGEAEIKSPTANPLVGGTRSGNLTVSKLVGVAGFEPTTSSSRTKRASQAALHPDDQNNLM